MPARAQDEQESLEAAAARALPALDATPDEKGDYVAARHAVQDPHYRGLYQLWTKVISFLVGKHWIKWSDAVGNYIPDDDVPEWRQQPTTNLTYAVFRTALAKFTKNKPTTEVVPPTGDSADREAAKLGEAVLVFLWRYLKTPQTLVRALGWFICTGGVFFDVDWDEEAGAMKPRTVLVERPSADDPSQTENAPCACDENGEAYRDDASEDGAAPDGGKAYDFGREPDLEPEGEIAIEVDDPFSVRFNPEATSPEDAEEWYIAKLWPRAEVCAHFDIDESDLVTASFGSGEEREEFDDAASRAASAAPDPYNGRGFSPVGTDQAEAIGPRVLVIYFYRKPNAKAGYPKGRHWIVAGRTKVWPPEGDDEYPHGEAELPFGFWPPRIPMIDTPVPGQPQGIGMLTQIVPLNEQLDHLDGKILEHHVTMTMGGVWFVGEEDKGIVITSEPGQVKVSRAMSARGREFAPFQAEMQPLPEAVYAERAVLMSKIQTVAGMSGIDMGQRPEGVTAGRAFLVLQEASDAAISTGIQVMERAIEELGRRQLVIAQQKYDEPRTIKIKGDEGEWQFRAFSRLDLKDGMEVRVQAGSMFPWSKSAQWDTKMSVIQAVPGLVTNLLTGEVNHEALSKILDAGGSGMEVFTSDEDPDMVEFTREVALFDVYDPMSPTGSQQLPELGVWMNLPLKQKLAYDFMKRSYSRFQRWTPPAQVAWMEWLRKIAEAVQGIVDSVAPPVDPNAPAPPGAGPAAPPTPAPTAPAGGGFALVPPGGTAGKANTPVARRGTNPMQITAGDRAAAGV